MNKAQLIKNIKGQRRLAGELKKTASSVYSVNYGSSESKGVNTVAQQRINRFNIASKQRVTKMTNKQLKRTLDNYRLSTGTHRRINVNVRSKRTGLLMNSTRIVKNNVSKEMLKKHYLRSIMEEGFEEVDIDKEMLERYINGEMSEDEENNFKEELKEARDARKLKYEMRKNNEVILKGEKNLINTVRKRGGINFLELDLNKAHNKSLYNVNNNHNKRIFQKIEDLASKGRVSISSGVDLKTLTTQHNFSTGKQQQFIEGQLMAVKRGINTAMKKQKTPIPKTTLKRSKTFINKFFKFISKIFR